MAVEKKKKLCADFILSLLSYGSVLLFIPLLKKKKSSFVSYHVNQGLVLFVLEFCCYAVLLILGLVMKFAAPALFFIIRAILGIVLVVFLLCHVIGILHVCFGQKRSVPFFGEIKLYKWEQKEDNMITDKIEQAVSIEETTDSEE